MRRDFRKNIVIERIRNMLLSKSVIIGKQIGSYRKKLYSAVKRKGVINDPEIIEISQELDKLILSLQKIVLSEKI
jgi:hypothetical protein